MVVVTVIDISSSASLAAALVMAEMELTSLASLPAVPQQISASSDRASLAQ